jgi:hypothetical protein
MKDNKFSIYGYPDGFSVLCNDVEVGRCHYKDKGAYPFIISDKKFCLGLEGKSHGTIFTQLLGMKTQEFDDRIDNAINSGNLEEFNRLQELWKKANELSCEGDDSVDGRIYLSINKTSNMPFNYTILSFWNEHNKKINGNLVNQIIQKFNVSANNVLVACFTDGCVGILTPLLEWDYYVPEGDDTQKNGYALHLMNAHDKHDATYDFRKARDGRIGKKLTNDSGVEMPVAQYRSMVYAEGKKIKSIIRNVLKEYIYKDRKIIIF